MIPGNSEESTKLEVHYLDILEEQLVQGVLISPYRGVDERLTTLRNFIRPRRSHKIRLLIQFSFCR